jgi:hypothetical protein
VLLPDDDPRLVPDPEVDRVLEPDPLEFPQDDPDQPLFRVELEGRVLEPWPDPPQEEEEREGRVVEFVPGESVALVREEEVAGVVPVVCPEALTARQMVVWEAGSPVDWISASLLLINRPPPALEFTEVDDQMGVRGATTTLPTLNTSDPQALP